MGSNPLRDYKNYYRANLPAGVTVSGEYFFYNGKRFTQPWAVDWYRGQLGEPPDTEAPTGYSVAFDQDPVNEANETAISFTFASAEIGAIYSYSIESSGGGTPVTGTGTIATGTDQITGIGVNGLSDGTLTLTVALTDVAGNGGADVTDTIPKDTTAPTGYSVAFDQASVTNINETAISFTFASAEIGTTYNYSITSSAGGTPVTGTGTISTVTEQVTGLNLSGLAVGTLTLIVTLTDTSGNTGLAATNTVTKPALPFEYAVCVGSGGDFQIIDISDPSNMSSAYVSTSVDFGYHLWEGFGYDAEREILVGLSARQVRTIGVGTPTSPNLYPYANFVTGFSSSQSFKKSWLSPDGSFMIGAQTSTPYDVVTIDTSDYSSMSVLDELATGSGQAGGVFAADFDSSVGCYVTSSRVVSVSFSNPSSMVVRDVLGSSSTYGFLATPDSVAMGGGVLFIMSRRSDDLRIHAIDVSNPQQISYISVYEEDYSSKGNGLTHSMALSPDGSTIFASVDNTLTAYDVSNPNNISKLDEIDWDSPGSSYCATIRYEPTTKYVYGLSYNGDALISVDANTPSSLTKDDTITALDAGSGYSMELIY
jgi:hypothetical protein